jgi:cellobiose PTS system EIIB component
MSTSLLVNRMREAARAEGLDCTIDAFPTSQAVIHGRDADVVLIGPQVKFELRKVQGLTELSGRCDRYVILWYVER